MGVLRWMRVEGGGGDARRLVWGPAGEGEDNVSEVEEAAMARRLTEKETLGPRGRRGNAGGGSRRIMRGVLGCRR